MMIITIEYIIGTPYLANLRSSWYPYRLLRLLLPFFNLGLDNIARPSGILVLILPEPLLPPLVDHGVQENLAEGHYHVQYVPGMSL